MAGGNSGGIESYLPIAAALAATVATDGAASPWLVESMGATAAGALTSGAAAAAASGLTAAVTGQDVGRSALTGAVTGGIGGALAGYNAAATVPGATAAPLTGANVAGTASKSRLGGGMVNACINCVRCQLGMGHFGAHQKPHRPRQALHPPV